VEASSVLPRPLGFDPAVTKESVSRRETGLETKLPGQAEVARIEALGGRFTVSSPLGRGTALRAEIPCA
jgi:hypothetical protein